MNVPIAGLGFSQSSTSKPRCVGSFGGKPCQGHERHLDAHLPPPQPRPWSLLIFHILRIIWNTIMILYYAMQFILWYMLFFNDVLSLLSLSPSLSKNSLSLYYSKDWIGYTQSYLSNHPCPEKSPWIPGMELVMFPPGSPAVDLHRCHDRKLLRMLKDRMNQCGAELQGCVWKWSTNVLLWFPEMGYPQSSSILIRFSDTKTIHFGDPYWWNPPYIYRVLSTYLKL